MENNISEDIIIEKLDVSNIDELYDLLQELVNHHNNVSKYFKGEYPSKPLCEKINEIKEKVKNGISNIDTIRLNNEIVAFSIYYIENNIGTLEYLFTSEKNRNMGYGQILMNNIMTYFTEKDVKKIEVMVVYGNDGAKRFYNRYGFQIKSEILSLIR